ncbi:putative F-box/LRR-repeat protein [Tripterygium wilfordii]|uniref:Putative F-box/LRR-repeat protein n=1 Tax=Tripterygium wilfordii TaxID=458696 RepID=A0A7J7CY63_TRIWF|nr:F-box/LRR-repeat protein 2 [Tripterygium wilfordii]KAF5739047.1 putative F-box/LRR-repeat protein [Tripterygium wilfordii]
MTEKSMYLPDECWELIFNSFDNDRHFEFPSLVCHRFLSITNQLRRTLTITNQVVHSLHALLRRFQNLKEIEIRNFMGDLDSLLFEISQFNLDLESIDFSKHKLFPCLGLRELGPKMRNLRVLNCSNVRFLQDSDVISIGFAFPFLEELDISYPNYSDSYCPDGLYSSPRCLSECHVTDAGIVELSLKLPNLRKIILSGNRFVTDKSLASLLVNCLLLEEIGVRDCDFITQKGIGTVLRLCPNLSSLSLNRVTVPCADSLFEDSFAFAKNLRELDLSHSSANDKLLCGLAKAYLPLKKLSFSCCRNISCAGTSFVLYNYRFLAYLDLEGVRFLSDEILLGLSMFLQNLTFINLNFCSKLTNLAFFTITRSCPLLSDIRMERTSLGTQDLPMDFAVNNKVKSLSLSANPNLGDECLKKIAFTCPNLQVLDVSRCPRITDEGISEILSSCCEIRHLEINHCIGIGNFIIDCQLPCLEVLRAQGPVINDGVLALLAERSPGLLHLDLESCVNVTTTGIKKIVANCIKLREINLKWCNNVSLDIVAWMVFSRPSLRRIVPPRDIVSSESRRNFFLLHGCFVDDSGRKPL